MATNHKNSEGLKKAPTLLLLAEEEAVRHSSGNKQNGRSRTLKSVFMNLNEQQLANGLAWFSVGLGQRYMKPLLDLIQQGKIDPSFVISHQMSPEHARKRLTCSIIKTTVASK